MRFDWNPSLYQTKHAFIWQYGRELIEVLGPQPGERILDIGCGTGQLTGEIAQSGAEVTGVDNSAEMIEAARRNYPALRFERADAACLTFQSEFDAVFSNAALHWVLDANAAAAGIARALKPGGRLVAEMGGKGNTQALFDAVARVQARHGGRSEGRSLPWYFPSVGEYATVLEKHGLEVEFATLFDRPTQLEGGEEGLANWLAMFGKMLADGLSPEQWSGFVRLISEYAAPALYREGNWFIDYRRLRVVARRVRSSGVAED